MQATQPKRRTHKLSQELFDIVTEPKPLVIGVHRQIQQELDLTDDATHSVMRWYVQRAAYRPALS